MMTRDEIRELAAFQADETKGACALSFYFQPDPPQDRSHRREANRRQRYCETGPERAPLPAPKNGALHGRPRSRPRSGHEPARQRPGKGRLRLASAQNFWKEYELPPQLGGTHIYLQPRFQLKPLAALLGAQPALCVAVVDRQPCPYLRPAARRPARTRSHCPHALAQTDRATASTGYEAGHAERRVSEEALQHFQGSCRNGCAPTSRKASGSGSLSDARMPNWFRVRIEPSSLRSNSA